MENYQNLYLLEKAKREELEKELNEVKFDILKKEAEDSYNFSYRYKESYDANENQNYYKKGEMFSLLENMGISKTEELLKKYSYDEIVSAVKSLCEDYEKELAEEKKESEVNE